MASREVLLECSRLRQRDSWSIDGYVFLCDATHLLKLHLEGHQYLCQIGILHRDISENNIVLPVNPGHNGGALIDFEMAVACKPNIHLQPQAHVPKLDTGEIVNNSLRSPSPLSDGDGPRKAERTVRFLSL